MEKPMRHPHNSPTIAQPKMPVSVPKLKNAKGGRNGSRNSLWGRRAIARRLPELPPYQPASYDDERERRL